MGSAEFSRYADGAGSYYGSQCGEDSPHLRISHRYCVLPSCQGNPSARRVYSCSGHSDQGSADRCEKSFSRVNYLIILAVLLAMMALKLTKVLMLLILAVVSIILIVRSGVLKVLLGGKDKDKRR